jgi:hypothetical protein
MIDRSGKAMFRRFMVALAASTLLVLGLAIQPAGASPVRDLQCGINPTTNVMLRADLTCATSFDVGQDLSTPPISIDLRGHTLTITAPDAPCRLNQPFLDAARCAIFGETKLTVRNGTVIGSIGLASQPQGGRVSDVHVEGDVWLTGSGGAVNQNTIDGTVHDFATTATVHSNWIRGGGITFDDSFNGLEVHFTSNLIRKSPGAGIIGSLGGGGEFPGDVVGEISLNTVTGSVGSGIEIDGALGNVGRLAIALNRLTNNGADGIRLTTAGDEDDTNLGGPVTLFGNVASRNNGHGIDASWITSLTGTGVVDGSGNIAKGDGLSPKCIGVICS